MLTNVVCQNCKFWEKFTDQEDIRRYGLLGTCRSPKMVYAERNIPDDCLACWDYEGYGAGIYTGKNFGCIHWEQNP